MLVQLIAHRLRGPDSPLSTYITNLPIGFSGIPMFFGKEVWFLVGSHRPPCRPNNSVNLQAIVAIEYPPVGEQVKKRCKWLFEFSKELAKLPGSAEDPFAGARVDINAMGESALPHCVAMRLLLFALDILIPQCDLKPGILQSIRSGWALACVTSRAFRTKGTQHPASCLPLIGDTS